MSVAEILVLVAAIIPFAGNIIALVLRRYGHHVAADWVVRMTPIAVVAASSRTREEAIRRVVEEVSRLDAPASEGAREAARELIVTPPPPSAAKLPPLPILLFVTGCTPLLCVACTPQQAQTAVEVTTVATDIAGAVCDELETPDSSPIVRMLCRAADVAGEVIGRTSTEDGGVQVPEVQRVEVPREDLADFCRRNTCRAPE